MVKDMWMSNFKSLFCSVLKERHVCLTCMYVYILFMYTKPERKKLTDLAPEI